MKVELNGIPIFAGNFDDLMKTLYQRIKGDQKTAVISANPEVLHYLISKNFKFDDEYIFIPDGIGTCLIVLVSKGKILKKIAGIDVFYEMLRSSGKLNLKLFFLGARDEVIKRAYANAIDKFNAKVVGYNHGYFDFHEEKTIVDKINLLSPDVLFVGLGCPKQEEFIDKYKDKLNVKLIVAVGGSFDVLAERVKRAPRWMISLGLEWLYRVMVEPVRIKRLKKVLIFVARSILNF
ncbi:WecB/TagA/CpsF family glycosyltransferase [Caloramator sp. CAR-1]|uniref:WecB/TagA/CpsF family glycosyltransferase n=1 Tax=Caloramator sp. CAR-1 TaxID=3062777 RepID=UPI0026E15301|nr:WecB/TagA/CpsF family glycosyltransferase [Caloramator sp. CAR-1]MDO6354942.1 WecB/TagA/CpsF family glycosyltransferase [Caloramator sp. CAR-1]